MPEMLARYEFKYLITDDQIAGIRSWARTYCEPDAYGVNGKYEVNSLYFDTETWTLAHQTLEGARNRVKIRVRTYGWEAADPVFCEIKGRVGASILKTRALMDRCYVNDLCLDRAGPFPALKASHQADLDQFRNQVGLWRLKPRVWVRYQREAYGSAFSDGARLTFDTCLQVQPSPHPLPYVPDHEQWLNVDLGGPQNILELKFNGAFPKWMLHLCRAFQLHRISCSKYVNGALLCGHLPWASLERSARWTAF